MKTPLTQTGSSHLLILLAVFVIAAVGLTGYRISQSDTHLAGNAPVANSSGPSEITSTAEVKKASNALDATPIDGDVNPAKLDDDLNAVL